MALAEDVEALQTPASAAAGRQVGPGAGSSAGASDLQLWLPRSEKQAGAQSSPQQLITAWPGDLPTDREYSTGVAEESELLGGFMPGALPAQNALQDAVQGAEFRQDSGASPVRAGFRDPQFLGSSAPAEGFDPSQGLGSRAPAEGFEPLPQRRAQSGDNPQHATAAETGRGCHGAGDSAAAGAGEGGSAAVLPEVVAAGWSEEVGALREGWQYMWAPHNRDVAGLVFIKASGSFVWGASDVLYVRCPLRL